ncbi:MAG: Zn-dependent hydrolase [Hyphomicrobiaceae bacterium]
MPKIDGARVLADLNRLRDFGRYETGVHRPTYSAEHTASLLWLAGRAADAGLAPTIDGIGNVLCETSRPGGRILVGSHLESQNQAGWLDGPLGVIYALEAARALAADPTTAHVPVDVVSFADEEGHFGFFLGSRSLAGQVSEADIDAGQDRTRGTTLRDALATAGHAGKPRLRVPEGRYVGFLEAHIEQGDWLEANDLKIGVVTSIVGIWQFRIVVEGVQNHAGTTRMAIRKDAGVALNRIIMALEARMPEVAGERSVWTTGRIALEPGAPSIIPGRAEMLFQIRDADPETLERMEAAIHDVARAHDAKGPCRVMSECLRKSFPAVMDPRIQAAIERAAERHAPGKAVRMPSGAGHDAQIMSTRMPAGMLFVPSIGGISHHWTENTSDDDIVLGAQVYADAVAAMADELGAGA